MKKILSLILVALLLFTLVGCNQNEQLDEMAQKIAQLEQALQNQADVNNELSAELEEQKAANDWLGQLILTQQGVIDKQQTQIGRAEEAIDNLSGKPIEFTESAPVYGSRDGEILVKEIITYYNYPQEESLMAEFNDYYKTNFIEYFDEEFYILEAVDINWFPSFLKTSVFAEEKDGEYVHPIIREEFAVSDGVQNNYDWHRYKDYEGFSNTLVRFDAYFVPLPIGFDRYVNFTRHLYLYFGKETIGEEEITYFNIWIEGNYPVCIGTCYYEADAPLSSRWFEKYFIKNLYKLGE